MLLKTGFRFRIDLTDSQRLLFSQFAEASRFQYNRGLAQRKQTYEQRGKSLSYFEQKNELVSLKREEAIGIDMELKSFATTASGPHHIAKHIENPRFFPRDLPRLRVLSRRFSKKVKGSKNWLKAKLQFSKLMELSDRIYLCGNCSLEIDRDLNSAIVEKAAGMSVLKACRATP